MKTGFRVAVVLGGVLLAAFLSPLWAEDWPLYGGTPARNGKGVGDTPFLEAAWRKPLAEQTTTQGWIEQATTFANQRKLPLLPSSFPIVVTATRDGKKLPLLFYRNHWGIHAVNVKTGDLHWKAPSAWSLDSMVSKSNKQTAITSWANHYIQSIQKPTLLFDNSTVGTLSSDDAYVYAIEDLAVAPPPSMGAEFDPRFGQPGGFQRYDKQVTDAIQHNKLLAYNLLTGKLMWELGGRGEKVGDLADSFFLGAPLPVDGKLWALVEKEGLIRAVHIDPRPRQGWPLVLDTVDLYAPETPLPKEPLRRMQASHLALADGTLVCPTNAGAVLGVDVKSREVLWTYPYSEPDVRPPVPEEVNPRIRRVPPGMVMGPDGRWIQLTPTQPRWQVSAPIIQDGKVIFTAPNARSVHCIGLRDGKRSWSHPRKEADLFLGGVFNGKVLVVGKHKVALNLARGEQLWELETGLPSGQGIASGNVYYLPLKAAVQGNEPEVCAIDIERGVVIAHTRSRKQEVLGNLVFADGMVISQTLTEVAAYPQLKTKLAQIDDRLTKDPDDPVGLTDRGELRLDRGDLQGAINDLLRAREKKPPRETELRLKLRLHEVLTAYFQRDFNAAEKYLKEYEELCKVDLEGAVTDQQKWDRHKEAQRRRADFLCLVARGKEGQRKLVEAFEKYVEFSALAGKDELIATIDEPGVRAAADVWSRGRIRAMIDSATPEERKPLEERIAARWDEVRKAKSLDELRNFVTALGSLSKSGKEARLQLAERLLEDTASNALLEAERHLYLLRGPGEEPATAGRAVECLARLELRKGLLRDAGYYYSLLRRDFAKVVIREKMTGSDVFDEMASDKRLLPYLNEPDQRPAGKVTASQQAGNFQYQNQIYQLGQQGEKLPFFQENQLAIRYHPHSLRVLNPTSGEEKWDKALAQTMFQNLVFGNGQPNMPKFCFHNLGHLVVLPLGHMVFGIDPINQTILWEKNLHAPLAGGLAGLPGNHTQLTVDPRDGAIQVTYSDGWVQTLGIVDSLGGEALCLQTRDALLGIDPLTGRILWARSDVSPRSRIFGDGEALYVVEINAEGRAASTRALRISDGVSIKVPDFAALFEKQVGRFGRTLAVSEPVPQIGTVLRLYDVRTGKDLWKGEFLAQSLALKSEDRELAGMVDPEGNVHVVSLRTGQEVLKTKVDPKHLAGALQAWLLSDSRAIYLAVNGPQDKQLVGPIQTALLPGTGLRCVPVNGMVYCFNRVDGKLRWFNEVVNQMLILEHFRELPIVLFASRVQQWNAQGVRRIEWVVSVRSIQKSNGRLLYESKDIPATMNFHALNLDVRGGKVELIGQPLKIVHQFNGDPPGR